MDKKSSKKSTHTETSTTVNVRAGYWPYSCGFFCIRTTNSDVIDPSKSSKEVQNEHPTIEPTAARLCRK